MRWSVRLALRGLVSVMVACCTLTATVSNAATELTRYGAIVGSAWIPYIFDIVPDPHEPGSVLLATQAGIYRARQDGTAERISYAENPVWSLSLGGVNGFRLFARGIADDGGAAALLVSDDQGRGWRALPQTGQGPTHLRDIAVSKANPNIMFAANDVFWRSGNAGGSWISMGGPARRVIDLAASATDADRVFAATDSGLYVSDDGGAAWRPTGGESCSLPISAVATGSDGAVYAFSFCSGMIRGDEHAEGWTVVNARFAGCIVQHLAVDPADSARVYAVIRCNTVLVSADGGVTWKELGSTKIWEPSCPTDSVGQMDIYSY